MEQVIKIQKFLPATITSRKAVEVFKNEIPLVEYSSYVFDFSDIDFISRAFADELFHFISEKDISVDFIHANSNIVEMFKAVQKNRDKRNNKFHKIAVTPFLEKEEFNNFLSLI